MTNRLSALWLRITDEPVLATTFVGAAITLAVTFGAPIDDAQKTAVLLVIAAGLAVFARSKVSPV